MIKAYTFHHGYFYLLVLEDNAISYRECPAAWFRQDKNPLDGKTNVTLEWPPPFMPKQNAAMDGIIDRATGIDSIAVTQV